MAGQERELDVTALFQQGIALHQQGHLADANRAYSKVLALQAEHFDALYLSGVIASQCQQPQLALERIAQAIAINPAVAPVHCSYGNVLLELSRCEDAIASYDRAIAINPEIPEAHYNRGIALRKIRRSADAIASYDRAIALRPDYAEAHANRANALLDLKCHAQAIADYDCAIAILPGYAQAHTNRGLALLELKRPEEAIASHDRAIAIRPDFAEAYWNKSLTLLTFGQLEAGWELYEWRWKRDEALQQASRGFAQPRWFGSENLAGKTVLLYAEQGMGDTIQFCRYARLVKALGAIVALEVPRPLMDLFSGLDGVDVLVETGSKLPAFDYHCPLLSLPLAFRTNMATIPNSGPYLCSSADRRAIWARRLGSRTKPRVGLVWSGNAAYKNDHNRSLSLTEVIQHLPQTLDYISLQKEVSDDEKRMLGSAGIRHYGDDLRDFADTAALCDLVDVVVSVDTSVAHLAGAIGKTTFIVLPYSSDWRWLLNRDDSPWYDSVTLYRQSTEMLWSPVLSRVSRDLLQGRGVSAI